MEKNCYVCGKKYTSWTGLMYHKRKVHNSINVHSALYEREIKNAAKKCLFCLKMHRKPAMEDHYHKEHKECFQWIKCKFGCSEVREEVFKDHIWQHNVHVKKNYYMKPEELEEMFKRESYDDIQDKLKELKEKRVESDRKIEEERVESDREFFKLVNSRPRLFVRDPLSGEILGCRQT